LSTEEYEGLAKH